MTMIIRNNATHTPPPSMPGGGLNGHQDQPNSVCSSCSHRSISRGNWVGNLQLGRHWAELASSGMDAVGVPDLSAGRALPGRGIPSGVGQWAGASLGSSSRRESVFGRGLGRSLHAHDCRPFRRVLSGNRLHQRSGENFHGLSLRPLGAAHRLTLTGGGRRG